MKRILLCSLLTVFSCSNIVYADWVDTPTERRETKAGDWQISGSIGNSSLNSKNLYDNIVNSWDTSNGFNGGVTVLYFIAPKILLSGGWDASINKGSQSSYNVDTNSILYNAGIIIRPIDNLKISLRHMGDLYNYKNIDTVGLHTQGNDSKRNDWTLTFTYGTFSDSGLGN